MNPSSSKGFELSAPVKDSLALVVRDLLAITNAWGAAVIHMQDGTQGTVLLGNYNAVDVSGKRIAVAQRWDDDLSDTQPYLHISQSQFSVEWHCEQYCDVLVLPLNVHSAKGALHFYLFVWVPKNQCEWIEASIALAKQSLELLLCKPFAVVGHGAVSVSQNYSEKVELLNEIGAISKTGGFEFAVDTQHIEWTSETYRIYGVDRNRPITLALALKPFPPEARKQLLSHLVEAVKTGKNYELELPFSSYSGKNMYVKASGRTRLNNGKVTHVYGALEDVSEQRKLSDTQHNYTAYLTAILDNLNDVVLTIDPFGMIITANQTVEKIFGYAPDEVIGEDISSLINEPSDTSGLVAFQHFLLSGDDDEVGNNREFTAIHKVGVAFPVELSLSKVKLDGQMQFVCIVRDITERKQATDHMYRVAFFDDVTGLPNIKSFERDVKALIDEAKDTNQDLYCCIVDIDNFAQYNVSFGKETGDYILQVVAERVTHAIGPEFAAYRGIGDNYFVLYKSCVTQDRNKLQVLNNVEWKLHSDILSEMTIHGHSHVVTSAVASAHIKGESATYEKVIGILDFGKRRAKSQGHGGRVSLEKSAFADYERHNFISQSFTKAAEDKEFYLVLQPQFDDLGNIVSSEALLRWEHQSLGFISPGEFIPIAEESDAIIDIGVWVLNEACRLLSEVKSLGIETCVSVNVSGRHIARPDFSDSLLKITRHWGIAPQCIMLEITETTLVSGIDLVRQRIERLSELGFSFSIDDFGTGYSSLSYLKELPIKELKIDRYFVDEINFAGENVPIVNTIIDMAHAMGVKTVAEGIENDIQMTYLKNRGCDIFQGFYLEKPLTEERWQSLLVLPKQPSFT